MVERGLAPEFSPAVLAEVASIAPPASSAPPSGRDLRALPWSSIDNDESRDLDQLEVAERQAAGTVKIRIAIADVDAMVPSGSAIDGHARANTTSVYTVAQVFPMLPERLSTDLTSLVEGQDRPAVVIEMIVAPDGSLAGWDLYRATVRNHAKLAYNSVAAWLETGGPPPARLAAVPGLDEQLRLQDEVAQALRTVRHQHGALSVETIETQGVFEGDALADLRVAEKNRAKELIEDFMIAANGATARFLTAKGFPTLRRVLHAPRRWDRIAEIAAGLGTRLPAAPDSKALERFLVSRRQADPAAFPDLSLTVIKLLGSGEYVVDLPGAAPEGHFGLAVANYSHSTAPNRRYPDLLTQRLLTAALAGRPVPYGLDALTELARHCTEQEDNAKKVERQVRKSASALLLESKIGRRFDAIVTGASEKGTWVRILHPPVEGKLVRGAEGIEVGARVTVELVHTDVARGFIDFVRT